MNEMTVWELVKLLMKHNPNARVVISRGGSDKYQVGVPVVAHAWTDEPDGSHPLGTRTLLYSGYAEEWADVCESTCSGKGHLPSDGVILC